MQSNINRTVECIHIFRFFRRMNSSAYCLDNAREFGTYEALEGFLGIYIGILAKYVKGYGILL